MRQTSNGYLHPDDLPSHVRFRQLCLVRRDFQVFLSFCFQTHEDGGTQVTMDLPL